MNLENKMKIDEAEKIVKQCLGKHGVWASPYRYMYQCWTRDFVIATEDLLLTTGTTAIIKEHLRQLALRQKPNGQIPIMYLDNTPRWLWIKISNSIRQRRISFLLKAYLSKDGIGSLSPWTRDSEFLFALGVLTYVQHTGDTEFAKKLAGNIRRALAYVEKHLVEDGLVRGVDWRDTRPDLDNKFLLTNNCLLYRVYIILGDEKKAEHIKNKINTLYWTGTHYRDYPGADEWDTLGNALSILFDIAPPDRFNAIFKKAEEFDSPFGYKLNSTKLPPKSKKEKEVLERTNQFGVIWPFIHGFMILAAIQAGRKDIALRQFSKWNSVNGFYEFYDPQTGNGYGSPDQMWSAALYLRSYAAIREI